MIGKESRQKAKGKRQKGERKARIPFSFFLFPFAFPRRERGFTLLELMIVISIIIILAVIVLPQYQRTVIVARESVLRDDLFQMRKMIDQYAADKGALPQSLEELVSAGYIREVPVDPITGQREWNVVMGPDPNSSENGQGVVDVHSTSTELSSENTSYSDW